MPIDQAGNFALVVEANWWKKKISFIFYAYRRTADLEQLHAFPLAPPATNIIKTTLLARLYALFDCAFLGNIRDNVLLMNIHHKYAASVTVKGVLPRKDWKIRDRTSA